MQPNMLVVGLLAAYPQTQTMQPTDEKSTTEVENSGPVLEKRLGDNKCFPLGEKKKKA